MSVMEEIYKKSIFYQKILTLASAKLFKGKTLIHIQVSSALNIAKYLQEIQMLNRIGD